MNRRRLWDCSFGLCPQSGRDSRHGVGRHPLLLFTNWRLHGAASQEDDFAALCTSCQVLRHALLFARSKTVLSKRRESIDRIGRNPYLHTDA